MTTPQILIMTGAYAVAFAAVVYFARATSRRVAGAIAGGVFGAALGVAAMLAGERIGAWWIALPATIGIWLLFFAGLAISLSPIYLITWRVARRFGWRGLAACLVVVAVIGPPRDYLYAAVFPEWMVFGRGVMPVVADAATYVGLVAVGHAVMRWVSGPTLRSQLSRRPSAG